MGADAAAEEQFGPYLVYERLGVGGMATVHRALERGIEGFERIVALKRLLPHLAADASFIKSFVREAKLASLLNHVNIVQIFELGRVGTEYFISMEYIDGRDIRRILRHARKVSGPPPIHVTVGLLIQICDALDYAHHKVDDSGHPLGLVHRDVSPSNLLVTSAGQVKVIDFGIAKAQSVQLRTQTGRVKGKLAYMAPEVLAGKDLDARSDLFAAGVIAHELLTARPLFATKNEYLTLMKVQRGEVMPPSTFNQGCPPELDAIVLRALARDPDERFLRAGDMRDELHAMRKQYNLQTADRDVAMWLDWAFSLEAPNGAFTASHTFDHSNSAVDALGSSRRRAAGTRSGRTEEPRRTEDHLRAEDHRRAEEEESIDIAWGADDHNHGAPVLLDDVPDVSDKHLTSASALGAEVRLDLDDLADDIPTSQPSHGARAPAAPPGRAPTAATASLLIRPVPRPKRPTPALHARQLTPAQPARAPELPAGAAARGAQHAVVTPNVGVGVGVRSGLMPPRVRTITIPPLGSASSSSPRTVPSLAPPPPAVPEPSEEPPTLAGVVPAMGTQPQASAPATARGASPAMPRGTVAATTLPLGARAFTPPRDAPAVSAQPRRHPDAATPPRVVPSGSTPPLARNSTLPATRADSEMMPSDPDTLPTTPPRVMASDRIPRPDRAVTEPTPAFSPDDLDLASDTVLSLPSMLPAMSSADSFDAMMQFRSHTPRVEPDEPEASPDPTPAAQRPRLITPATALFAEPDPDGEASQSRTLTASSHGTEHAPLDPATPAEAAMPAPRGRLRRALVVLAVLVILGAAAAAAALYLARDRDTRTDVRQPAPPTRSATVGTVHFVVTPTDSTIAIEGQQGHTGSPWSVELPPGAHQIEIHHDGFKAWLTSTDVVAGQTQTLNVPLEPLDSAVLSDATLIVGSTPPGLEVVLDGGSIAGNTPIKASIKVGPHTVVLRKDGIDAWKTTLDARASAVYEFSPTLAPRGPRGAGQPSDREAADQGPGAQASGTPAAPLPGGSPAPVPTAPPPTAPSPAAAAPTAAAPTAPSPMVPAIGTTPPLTIPASAIKKLSGAPPGLSRLTPKELPPEISARLCIDETGHVTSAAVLTQLPPEAGAEIVGALRTWLYAPYRMDGAARAACFVIAFRVK
jgi:serine/threonine protein kinase